MIYDVNVVLQMSSALHGKTGFFDPKIMEIGENGSGQSLFYL